MADYAELINIYDYLYKRPVYYTNTSPQFRSTVTTKLVLNNNNFNFDLAKSDGSDFRLISSSSGYSAFNMWIAYWNSTTRHAVIFFKLLNIGSNSSVELTACWGNANAISISDPNSVDLLFSEKFLSSPLNSSKWTGNTSEITTAYGYRTSYMNTSLVSITNPLLGLNSWLIEAGIYADFDVNTVNAYTSRSVGLGLSGTENNFDINVLQIDRIRANVVQAGGGTFTSYIKPFGGLEGYSYNELSVSYDESIDTVTVKLKNRDTYPDVEYNISRIVEGDTRPNNIVVYGRETDSYNTGGSPVYISWIALRNLDSSNEIDGRDLYVPYELVNHEGQDFRAYSSSICSLQYQHESSFGGNPYLLSNNGYDSDSNVWVSDVNATVEASVAVTINTAWGESVNNRDYTHYDSDHDYYFNASKLSDKEEDNMERTYWQCTTTSGWAAIKFSPGKNIGAVRIKNTTVSGAMPKNYEFYGSNSSPVYTIDKGTKLSEGTLRQTTDWQPFILTNHNTYRYYVLNVLNTYSSLPIKIQEWEMMDSIKTSKKKYVSQLRLHPSLSDGYIEKFPKEISLQGSNDGFTWITLMPWTKTYTPFFQHIPTNGYWQSYTFYNTTGYWSFRLLCKGNWGSTDGKISIGEWSLNELLTEAYTHRITGGSSNNFQQVWASNTCGLSDSHGIIFLANDTLNRISADSLISSENLPTDYIDFNII